MANITNSVVEPKVVTIYGEEYQPKVGSYILIGDKLIGDKLLPGQPTVDSGFAGCQFYLPTGKTAGIKELACNVEITGRTKQRRNGALYVKVKITWVGDCEPDQYATGWMPVS